MTQPSTKNPIKRFCRTFEHLQDDSVPCSVTERIERDRGLLRVDELSPLLDLSRKTIYAWVAAGTLQAVRMGASIKFCPHTSGEVSIASSLPVLLTSFGSRT
jgi:excisionase family DNA binding protein